MGNPSIKLPPLLCRRLPSSNTHTHTHTLRLPLNLQYDHKQASCDWWSEEWSLIWPFGTLQFGSCPHSLAILCHFCLANSVALLLTHTHTHTCTYTHTHAHRACQLLRYPSQNDHVLLYPSNVSITTAALLIALDRVLWHDTVFLSFLLSSGVHINSGWHH